MVTKYESEHAIGGNNVQIWGMDIHSPVFFVSAILIIAFVLATVQFPHEANSILTSLRSWFLATFDSFMMISVSGILIFCLILIVLPVGKIRIGGEKSKPEFSRLSWFSMLFAAGMAMAATLYHWGLHAWSIYAVIALALAFFSFNCDLPLSLRSAFYPLLGERCWGWPGHVIDIFAVLATIFGLATSLGLGASQVNAGLAMLFGIEDGLSSRIAIIIVVTFVAIASVARGIDGGIKVLSNINMMLAALLLAFIAFVIGNVGILDPVMQTAGNYLANIVPLSNWTGREDEQWLRDWTVFYWAWWVSWSPFVGLFIARVSRGRTVREFLIAVLLIPTFVTLLWMSVFGVNALYQVQNEIGGLANGMASISLATFQMLEGLPYSGITTVVSLILVLVFFITSSDSGSLVIDGITAGGKSDAPIIQRIFWAAVQGLLAATLLYGGGEHALAALQAGTVAAGIPFTVILLLVCVSLYKGLHAHMLDLKKY